MVDVQAEGVALGRWGVADDAIHWCAGETQSGFTSTVAIPGLDEVSEPTEGPMEDSVWSYKCGPARMKLIYFGPRAIEQDVRWELTRRD